jgi:hypothetical protein
MKRQQELKAEIKLLTAIYSDEVFAGKTIRQAKPSCCGKEINLFATNVAFREINLGKNVFHLLEPTCPACGKKVEAVYHLLI